MTPEEAIAELSDDLDADDRNALGMLFDAVAATAKAEGKANETRRCVARVKIWTARQAWSEGRQRAVNWELGNEILRSGGLVVKP